ncbi:MAG TPA: hypothetical protein VE988_30395 [Gemmataceae bacterium]|nr:hypothetical protein [Gemmataceae bacterium]
MPQYPHFAKVFMRPCTVILFAACVYLGAGTATAQASMIQNGNFSTPGSPPAPFAVWTTTLGDPPTNGGGFAVFTEGPNLVELEQAFLMSANPLTISFEFKLSREAGGSTGGAPDSFQATLWDAAINNPFAATGSAQFPAFFSVDNTGQEFYDSSLVSVTALAGGWQRVTLNVSSLPSQSRILEFDLNGFNDGQTTTAFLDNVDGASSDAAIVPEPGALLLGLSSGPCLLLALRFRRRTSPKRPLRPESSSDLRAEQ